MHFLRRTCAPKRSPTQNTRTNLGTKLLRRALTLLFNFFFQVDRGADANTLQGPESLATCTSKLFAAACHSIPTAFTRAKLFSSSVKATGPVPASAALIFFQHSKSQTHSTFFHILSYKFEHTRSMIVPSALYRISPTPLGSTPLRLRLQKCFSLR